MPLILNGTTGVSNVQPNTIVASDFTAGAVEGGFGSSINFRNKIMNGNFDIWQRGTSQTSAGYGSADRWAFNNTGSTKTTSRQTFALGQTDVPNNPTYFSRTVVSSVAGAGNVTAVVQ